MNKQMIGAIILIIAVISLVIFIDKESSPEKDTFFRKIDEFKKNDTNQSSFEDSETEECSEGECNINETSGVAGGTSGGSGSSGAGEGGTGSDSETDESDSNESTGDIPEDADMVECGLYTGEYGVCSGTCPEGECVRGGPNNESCYCQKS